MFSFYLKYRKVAKCAGSGVEHWLVTMGKSSNFSESQFPQHKAMVFTLKDVVKIELFFICLMAYSKFSINGSNYMCVHKESSLPPTQTGYLFFSLIQVWLPPDICLAYRAFFHNNA